MALLLIAVDPPPAVFQPVSRIGGMPLSRLGFAWPSCGGCSKPLSFVAQLRTNQLFGSKVTDRLFVLYECAQGCDLENTKFAGLAFALPPKGLAPLLPPSETPQLAPITPIGIRLEPLKLGLEPQARTQIYREAIRASTQRTIGQVGQWPIWHRAMSIPACTHCGGETRLLAQIEHGPQSALRWGPAGSAFIFDCPKCPDAQYAFQSSSPTRA